MMRTLAELIRVKTHHRTELKDSYPLDSRNIKSTSSLWNFKKLLTN
jgi:hypothetical protein